MTESFPLYFIATFLLSLAVTPVCAKISLALGIIDLPSRKKFHLTSMPLLGGVAIAFAFFAVMTFLAWRVAFSFNTQVLALMGAAFLMLLTGLVDDIRDKGISPLVKLILQTAASCVMLAGGVRLKATGIYPVDAALTIIWVAGISNALNLLDNIDGLSSGTAAITGCFFSLFALIAGRPDIAVIAVVFSGACMGFLFHNFHPATLFLGDAGSMFLGTMLAGFGLIVATPRDPVSIMAIGVVLGLLIFDTGLVTIMRVAHGYKITQGGKDHTSHRLCNLGLSVQGSVAALFCSSFVFGISGIAMLKLERSGALLIPLALFFISATCWFLLKDTFKYNSKESAS